jgi:type IV pilus assembly protein PilC
MPDFFYTALDSKGHKIKGLLTAKNKLELAQLLDAKGCFLIHHKDKKKTMIRNRLNSVSLRDLINFCLQLSQMLQAGMPLMDGLKGVQLSTANKRFFNILDALSRAVSRGHLLSEALSEHPLIFDAIFIGLIRIGEKTGDMTIALQSVLDYLTWRHDFQSKLQRASRYPLFLLILVVCLICVLLHFVIPSLKTFLDALGQDLPFSTRLLLKSSPFMADIFIGLLFIAGSVWGFLKISGRFSAMLRYRFCYWAFKIPFVGKFFLKADMTRFFYFFGVLLNHQTDILSCIKDSSRVLSNEFLKRSVLTLDDSIKKGFSLSQSLEKLNIFPGMVIRMIEVGEGTGKLGETFFHLGRFYKREVEEEAASLLGVIEPCALFVVGLFIMWIVFAVFVPLYDQIIMVDF